MVYGTIEAQLKNVQSFGETGRVKDGSRLSGQVWIINAQSGNFAHLHKLVLMYFHRYYF